MAAMGLDFTGTALLDKTNLIRYNALTNQIWTDALWMAEHGITDVKGYSRYQRICCVGGNLYIPSIFRGFLPVGQQ